MNWFYPRDEVLISVTGCQIGRGAKFRKPGNCPVLSNCFLEVSCFQPIRDALSLFLGFICLIVKVEGCSVMQASSRPLQTQGKDLVNMWPWETTAEKQMHAGSRHKLSVICLYLLWLDVSYRNAILLIQKLSWHNYLKLWHLYSYLLRRTMETGEVLSLSNCITTRGNSIRCPWCHIILKNGEMTYMPVSRLVKRIFM